MRYGALRREAKKDRNRCYSTVTVLDPLPEPSSQWRQAHRDRYLEQEIAKAITSDRRLNRIGAVTLRIAGGVAHLGGSVNCEKDRSLLRHTVGMFRGIQAVWDLLEVSGHKPLILDLGSGDHKQAISAIGVDRNRLSAVDVIADLEEGLCFADASVDHVFAVHILEHIHNLIPLMNEIHRVLVDTGVLHVLTPFWHHSIAVADPTHVRFFGPETFRAFCTSKNGIKPYKPLVVTLTEDTVLVDLQPIKDGDHPDEDEIFRFFS